MSEPPPPTFPYTMHTYVSSFAYEFIVEVQRTAGRLGFSIETQEAHVMLSREGKAVVTLEGLNEAALFMAGYEEGLRNSP